MIDWQKEHGLFLALSGGDWGVFAFLAALRQTEAGRAGRELGVLSIPAPTLAQQIDITLNSIRNRTKKMLPGTVRDAFGFFTDEFLVGFSHQWAPTGGTAENDPHGLNEHHLGNLRTWHLRWTEALTAAARVVPSP